MDEWCLKATKVGYLHEFLAVEATNDGIFRLPPGANLVAETPVDDSFDASHIEAVFALFEKRGPAKANAEATALLAAKTGLSRPELISICV